MDFKYTTHLFEQALVATMLYCRVLIINAWRQDASGWHFCCLPVETTLRAMIHVNIRPALLAACILTL